LRLFQNTRPSFFLTPAFWYEKASADALVCYHPRERSIVDISGRNGGICDTAPVMEGRLGGKAFFFAFFA
jgi:hypothetical protein